MTELNKEKFGLFVAQLRHEQGLTQKGLAAQLHVTDKAVSKWERGLSLPDVTLLTPLAQMLKISVSELLAGARLPESAPLQKQDAEDLVRKVIDLSSCRPSRLPLRKRRMALPYLLSILAGGLEFLLLIRLGYAGEEVWRDLGVYLLLPILLGSWFCFFSPDRIPDYYDQNRIGHYHDGPFKMNLPGVRFTNRNFPYLVRVGQIWSMATMTASPILYWLLRQLFDSYQQSPAKYIQLAATLISIFLPMIYTGRKYE